MYFYVDCWKLNGTGFFFFLFFFSFSENELAEPAVERRTTFFEDFVFFFLGLRIIGEVEVECKFVSTVVVHFSG